MPDRRIPRQPGPARAGQPVPAEQGPPGREPGLRQPPDQSSVEAATVLLATRLACPLPDARARLDGLAAEYGMPVAEAAAAV
ncbi:MAG TPA: hypothetical protein VES42_06690, partial [Pilimelia sp.]|nr:hypothetical protein [Pilimelia sp.]